MNIYRFLPGFIGEYFFQKAVSEVWFQRHSEGDGTALVKQVNVRGFFFSPGYEEKSNVDVLTVHVVVTERLAKILVGTSVSAVFVDQTNQSKSLSSLWGIPEGMEIQDSPNVVSVSFEIPESLAAKWSMVRFVV